MEPRIQYAHTTDGVSIAYWTMGVGMPLVYMPPNILSSVQLAAQIPEWISWSERLSRTRMLVRYDGRGSGLSDRDVSDFSLEGQLLDLDAVVDCLGLERFALLGSTASGLVAITYAARHSERVGNLILWCTWKGGADTHSLPQFEGLLGLLEKDWELFVQTAAHLGFGWSEGAPARLRAAAMRESVTPEVARAFFQSLKGWDVSELLPQVRSQTLVLHRRQVPGLDAGRVLASRIPNARLVVLEGASVSMYIGDAQGVASVIGEFLGEGEEAVAEAQPLAAGDVHTILFTDMESSAALRRKLGDAKVQELVRKHNQIVRDALKTSGGSEIKHTGDGIMASFSTATSALQCAIAIQRGVASHAEEEPDMPLRVYIGLNAGEPIAEEQDLFGTSVDLAKRICDHAEPGQILASNVVRELSEGKGFLFGDIGDVVPKGFEDPVRLYEVRWRAEGSP